MSSTLVKLRLSNCRSVKPFWVEIDEINDAFRSLNEFIKKYCHEYDKINIRGHHHLIFFHQLSSYKVDGYAIKDHVIISPHCKRLPKVYRRRFKCKKRYCTNTKVNYWATNGIYPIPLPKIISNQNKLKDSSGINTITRDQLDRLLIDKCFGIYYNNTLNYAKMQGWDIQFNIDCLVEDKTHEFMEDVSPAEVLRIAYSNYKFAIEKLSVEKKIIRRIANSTYGWLRTALPLAYDYSDVILNNRQCTFGKFIIECEYNGYKYWKEIELMVNGQQYHLIDEIKEFITEVGIDQNTRIIITLKTDTIDKEANNADSKN